ncbi:MAG: hypothetical protein KBS95_01745, partial [Alistipes sp.]|nr:hypothetical protein [Candidatus Alistipes equi]
MKHTVIIVAFVLLGITSCQQKLSEAEATKLVENAKENVGNSQRTLDSISDAVTGASYSSAEE